MAEPELQEAPVPLCPWDECLGLGMPKSGVPYMSLTLFLFISFHLSPSHISLYPSPVCSPFQHLHPLFPLELFPPLPHPPCALTSSHTPSDWFLCPTTLSSSAATAAWQPPACGAASPGAVPTALPRGKSRKCQWGWPCRARSLGQHCWTVGCPHAPGGGGEGLQAPARVVIPLESR